MLPGARLACNWPLQSCLSLPGFNPYLSPHGAVFWSRPWGWSPVAITALLKGNEGRDEKQRWVF